MWGTPCHTQSKIVSVWGQKINQCYGPEVLEPPKLYLAMIWRSDFNSDRTGIIVPELHPGS